MEVGETPGKSCSEGFGPGHQTRIHARLDVACMIVFSVITCRHTFKSIQKTRLLTADPPEDDDPRLERGPDPWNFAVQIDWEGDDDGYPM
ncbi:hypothetical protein CEXT_800201 [Caerostris extrusa]|uniref:Uncharacterized protein n=1 Tax=Caerostris extrusa TaxID=172846 RepID=A0AAV4XQS9_CAEEX|nr:hypothetical protein CEXT_800201 [Caerostris extrusa]